MRIACLNVLLGFSCGSNPQECQIYLERLSWLESLKSSLIIQQAELDEVSGKIRKSTGRSQILEALGVRNNKDATLPLRDTYCVSPDEIESILSESVIEEEEARTGSVYQYLEVAREAVGQATVANILKRLVERESPIMLGYRNAWTNLSFSVLGKRAEIADLESNQDQRFTTCLKIVEKELGRAKSNRSKLTRSLDYISQIKSEISEVIDLLHSSVGERLASVPRGSARQGRFLVLLGDLFLNPIRGDTDSERLEYTRKYILTGFEELLSGSHRLDWLLHILTEDLEVVASCVSMKARFDLEDADRKVDQLGRLRIQLINKLPHAGIIEEVISGMIPKLYRPLMPGEGIPIPDDALPAGIFDDVLADLMRIPVLESRDEMLMEMRSQLADGIENTLSGTISGQAVAYALTNDLNHLLNTLEA